MIKNLSDDCTLNEAAYASYIIKRNITLNEKLIALFPSRLLVLTGMSCVGKSHLAKRLVNINNDLIHFEMDQLLFTIVQNKLRSFFSGLNLCHYDQLFSDLGRDLHVYLLSGDESSDSIQLYNSKFIVGGVNPLKNIRQAILSDKTFLDGVHNTITHEIMCQVYLMMLLGRSVILDVVATGHILNSFKRFSPCIVMLYRSLQELSNNLQHRNCENANDGEESDFRSAKIMHSQWSMFFSRKKINEQQHDLSIRYQDFIRVLRGDLAKTKTNECRNTEENRVFIQRQLIALNLLSYKDNHLVLKDHVDLSVNYGVNDPGKTIDVIQYLLTMPRNYYDQTRNKIPPSVVLLDGMSMSGKTTIAQAFSMLHKNTVMIGRSQAQRRLLMEAMPESLKSKNTHGEKIFNYARNFKLREFRRSFSVLDNISLEYLEEINQYCTDSAEKIFIQEECQAAKESKILKLKGKTVLLDNLIFKNDTSMFSSLNPLIVLIYCPFNLIVKHIRSRFDAVKTQKDPAKWRNPFKIYSSYTVFFGPEDKYDLGYSVDILKRHEVEKVISILFDEFKPESYGLTKSAYQNEILTKLGLHEKDTVMIYPQLNKPDFVLNTGKSAFQNAQKLIEYINVRNEIRQSNNCVLSL